jgi:hypothetical protein
MISRQNYMIRQMGKPEISFPSHDEAFSAVARKIASVAHQVENSNRNGPSGTPKRIAVALDTRSAVVADRILRKTGYLMLGFNDMNTRGVYAKQPGRNYVGDASAFVHPCIIIKWENRAYPLDLDYANMLEFFDPREQAHVKGSAQPTAPPSSAPSGPVPMEQDAQPEEDEEESVECEDDDDDNDDGDDAPCSDPYIVDTPEAHEKLKELIESSPARIFFFYKTIPESVASMFEHVVEATVSAMLNGELRFETEATTVRQVNSKKTTILQRHIAHASEITLQKFTESIQKDEFLDVGPCFPQPQKDQVLPAFMKKINQTWLVPAQASKVVAAKDVDVVFDFIAQLSSQA